MGTHIEVRAPIIPCLIALTKDTQKQRILRSKQVLRDSLGGKNWFFFRILWLKLEKRKENKGKKQATSIGIRKIAAT